MLTDIGVNLSSARFAKDVPDVLENAQKADVAKMILTGTSVEDSRSVIGLCETYANDFPSMLYATAGIHPHSAETFNANAQRDLQDMVSHPSVVAVGETGLDFYRNLASEEAQQRSFEAHLEIAINAKLPLFLHERNAAVRQIEILHTYRDLFTDAVIHCFTSDRKTLYKYLDMDLHIGITGWICDERRGRDLQELVADIPLNRLMIETDSPYLIPRNMAFSPKNNRNEPAFLPWVAEGISAHRPESKQQIVADTGITAQRFFRL